MSKLIAHDISCNQRIIVCIFVRKDLGLEPEGDLMVIKRDFL